MYEVLLEKPCGLHLGCNDRSPSTGSAKANAQGLGRLQPAPMSAALGVRREFCILI
jgi:hypothetical protein